MKIEPFAAMERWLQKLKGVKELLRFEGGVKWFEKYISRQSRQWRVVWWFEDKIKLLYN